MGTEELFDAVFSRIEALEASVSRGQRIRSSNHEALSSRVKALEEQLAELAELVRGAKPAAQRLRTFGVDYGKIGEDYTVYAFADRTIDGLNPKLVQSVREHFGKIGLPLSTKKTPDNKGGEFAYFHPSQLENGYPGLPIVCFDGRGNTRFCIYADRVDDRHELIGWFPDQRPISRWIAWQDWMEIERPTHGKPALMELAGYLIRRNHEMRKSSPVATPTEKPVEKTAPAVKFSSPEAVCAGIGHQMVLRNSNDGSKLVCSRCGHVRSETRGDVTVNRGPGAPPIVEKQPDKEAKLVGPTGKPCQRHSFISLEGSIACAICGMRIEDFLKAVANTATKPA